MRTLRHFLTLLLFGLSTLNIQAQTQWTYNDTTPVLAMDTTYMWEAMGQPSVIFHNDTLKMWYAVASGTSPVDTVLRGRIRYAWSLDGVNWTNYPGNPVLNIGTTGEWDDEWLDTPEILWDGTQFFLYYYGDSTYFQGQSNTNLGVATSPDGIHWTKHGVVLSKGALGDWDGKYIESPAVLFDQQSGTYTMWYQGQDTSGWINIGVAFSEDGFSWTKYAGNPVLTTGTWLSSWDDMFAAVPSVIAHDGYYEMFYSGVSFYGQWDSVRIGYAISTDGINWIKYPGNPVLSTIPGDSAGFWAVDVAFDDQNNEYLMYYEGLYIADAQAIYRAVSPQSLLLSANCNSSVSPGVGVVAGDSAQISASGGTSYLWYPAAGLSNPEIANPMASPDVTTTYKVMIISDSCLTIDSVEVVVFPTSDNASNNLLESVQIFPNPFSEKISINNPSEVSQKISLSLYSSDGKLVYQTETGLNNIEISTSELSSGIYLLLFKSPNGNTFTRRLTKN
ncbi:MAG: T9SS type A sorting domain-containing protein [Bacteroidetes bacterium]|nr:T9SS type A sorting domain-containing protein [Bacteroidota bacterium]MBU1718225.1 T9SS type A sorting domain-containing protein [Bacteroidota bacterium]